MKAFGLSSSIITREEFSVVVAIDQMLYKAIVRCSLVRVLSHHRFNTTSKPTLDAAVTLSHEQQEALKQTGISREEGISWRHY